MTIKNTNAANTAAMFGRASRIAILLSRAPHYAKKAKRAEYAAYANARAAGRAGLIALGGAK